MIGALRFGDVDGSTDTFRQVRIISTPISWADRVNQEVDHEPQVLPQNLGQNLFASLQTDQGLGIDQFWFFGNPAFHRMGIACTNN